MRVKNINKSNVELDVDYGLFVYFALMSDSIHSFSFFHLLECSTRKIF